MPKKPRFCLPNRLALFFLLLLASAAALSCGSKKPAPAPINANSNLPLPRIEATAPLEISENPLDIAQCGRISKLIADRNANYEKWGVLAVSLKDGRAPCGVNPKALFSPASIQKLLTSAVALEKLGPDFSVQTSVYSNSAPVGGKIDGDLMLYGRGAPDFGKAEMAKLVGDLKAQGIRAVSGNIIGDESYFKGNGLGDGWTWNEVQWYYGAEASALTFEKNRVRIKVRNGKPSADSAFVIVKGRLAPVKSVEAVGLRRKLGANEVFVWGYGRDLDARVAVSDPALFTARVFKELLERNGISVSGDAISKDWTNPGDPAKLRELASVKSEPLSETIREMNKDSINLSAELLIRALGKEFGDSAPDKDPKMNLLRGDDLAGTAYVKKWLVEKSLSSEHIAVHDGSGLSRLNRMSPEAVVRVLIYAAKSPYSKAFSESLPIAGRDGTLRNRFKSSGGRVFAKTGSIQYANSLAGYLTSGDETFAFAIICNDETERGDSSMTIDAIVDELLGSDGSP